MISRREQLRIRMAFDMIAKASTVTLLTLGEMESLVQRAINQEFDTDINWTVRFAYDRITCQYCISHKEDNMMPPHDASLRCLSGSKNHCTCDICF